MTCRNRPARWVVGRRLVCSVALRSHRGGDLPLRASAGVRNAFGRLVRSRAFKATHRQERNTSVLSNSRCPSRNDVNVSQGYTKAPSGQDSFPMWMNRSGHEILTQNPPLVGWKAAATLRLRSSSPTAQTSRSTGRWLRPTRAAPQRPTTRRRPASRSLPAIEDSNRARIAPLQRYRVSAYSATFQMKVRSTVSLGPPHWAKSRTIELTFSLDI